MSNTRRRFLHTLAAGTVAMTAPYPAAVHASTLTGWAEFRFAHDGVERRVFMKGDGPGILLMHELPGMTRECVALAERIVTRGYAVYMPLIFGEPMRSYGALWTPVLCISREFTCFATGETSPFTVWLRALSARIRDERTPHPVGVIGMCFTGGFLLSLMIDPHVLAPVSCQPALPFAIGATRAAALGISDADLEHAKARAREGVRVLGFRFTEDSICPHARFLALRRELGDRFDGTEIDSSSGNKWGIPHGAHAVLTKHFTDTPGHPTREALDKTLAFFDQRLKGRPAS